MSAEAPAVDKRRQILDAAVRVFARQGFHTCRVSDIADEAGVAYGLVYHYFGSKEEVLDTLFLERWDILLEAIAHVDNRRGAARDKLYAVAGFIIGSFRTDIDAEFAAMAFYGAIEQVLTGWIFGLLDSGDEDFEEAKRFVVDTICGGLDAPAA